MTESISEDLIKNIADYYTDKVEKFGETPRGVDWNGEDGQVLRFEQLCKIIEPKSSFSISDLGCGYGALLDYLKNEYENFLYHGVDISEAMIKSAARLHAQENRAHFTCSTQLKNELDYVVASGIFNVRLKRNNDEWLAYIYETLSLMDRYSSQGFAFNCLTSYSDKEKMRDYLYYADPCELFKYCKRHFSRNVTLLHDYDLYEFTVLVRKK